MYFGTKSYLKSTRNHTAKHARIYPFWAKKEKNKSFTRAVGPSSQSPDTNSWKVETEPVRCRFNP
jgi:hypothetical protein